MTKFDFLLNEDDKKYNTTFELYYDREKFISYIEYLESKRIECVSFIEKYFNDYGFNNEFINKYSTEKYNKNIVKLYTSSIKRVGDIHSNNFDIILCDKYYNIIGSKLTSKIDMEDSLTECEDGDITYDEILIFYFNRILKELRPYFKKGKMNMKNYLIENLRPFVR